MGERVRDRCDAGASPGRDLRRAVGRGHLSAVPATRAVSARISRIQRSTGPKHRRAHLEEFASACGTVPTTTAIIGGAQFLTTLMVSPRWAP
ncbi:hypothetical protein [Nocardia africana]|nr:hypothetical protein [Nocardia africana]